jgi:hypothetical protein
MPQEIPCIRDSYKWAVYGSPDCVSQQFTHCECRRWGGHWGLRCLKDFRAGCRLSLSSHLTASTNAVKGALQPESSLFSALVGLRISPPSRSTPPPPAAPRVAASLCAAPELPHPPVPSLASVGSPCKGETKNHVVVVWSYILRHVHQVFFFCLSTHNQPLPNRSFGFLACAVSSSLRKFMEHFLFALLLVWTLELQVAIRGTAITPQFGSHAHGPFTVYWCNFLQ